MSTENPRNLGELMAMSESTGPGQMEHLSSVTQGEGRQGLAFIPSKTLGWIINRSNSLTAARGEQGDKNSQNRFAQCRLVDFFHCWGGSWVDRKKMTNMIDFDFSKPFDTVPHDIFYLCIWFFPFQSAVLGTFPCWTSSYWFQATRLISYDLP